MPESTPEEPMEWTMLEKHDEIDIEPVHDELELIDLPAEPRPSHPPRSNLERSMPLRLLYGRGPRCTTSDGEC